MITGFLHFILCGAVIGAPPTDDFAWIRGANYVPSYAQNKVQTWMAALHAGATRIANDLPPPGDAPRPTVLSAAGGADRTTRTAPTQYVLFNRAPGQGMDQGRPESLGRRQFEEVLARFPNRPAARVQTGVSYVFNWESIRASDSVLNSMTALLEASRPPPPSSSR